MKINLEYLNFKSDMIIALSMNGPDDYFVFRNDNQQGIQIIKMATGGWDIIYFNDVDNDNSSDKTANIPIITDEALLQTLVSFKCPEAVQYLRSRKINSLDE